MSEQRFIDLETQFSHHEREIEELQKTVFEQQLVIDKLEKRLSLVVEQFKGSLNSGQEIGPADEKPPHY